MQKQAPTLGRLLVMTGFTLSCFGLLLFLWLAFGGPIPLQPKGYRVNISFPEATQLAQEADVRISGVPVGKVKKITPNGGRSLVELELEQKFAPLPSDAQAILRQKTLLGETYVELTPGQESAKPLPENGTLGNSQVSDTVELDEIFQAFQPRTRAEFQNWLESQAQAVTGRGQDISDAIGNLTPFATDTTSLLKVLNQQEGAVTGLISNSGVVFDALTAREDQLTGLITNGNRLFETTADRNRQLQEIFTVLPTFQRETRTTLNRLDEFAEDTDPLITDLRPAAAELSPTLIELEKLSPYLRDLFTDVQPLVNAGRKGLPAIDTVLIELQPLLGQVQPFLRTINPPLYGLSQERLELTSFFSNTVAATQATDRPPKAAGTVHYLRTANPVNPENLAVYQERIGTNRPNPYPLPQAFKQLATGLAVYENRQCGRTLPLVTTATTEIINGIITPITAIIPQPVLTEVNEFVYGALNNPGTPINQLAPPCRLQGKFPPIGGRTGLPTTQYPQVRPDPPGQTPVNAPLRLGPDGQPITTPEG